MNGDTVDGAGGPAYVVHMNQEPTIDQLRAAVVDRAVAVTYAVVAEELGMKRASLNNFLHGSRPYAKTLTRMREWYALHYPDGIPPLPISDAFGRLSAAQKTTLQSAVEQEIVRTSRRAVARSVKMSSDGLQKFLDGAPPSTITVEKLLRWHARVQGDTNPTAHVKLLLRSSATKGEGQGTGDGALSPLTNAR